MEISRGFAYHIVKPQDVSLRPLVVGRTVSVRTHLEATGCMSCIESIEYDSQYLTLLNPPDSRDHGGGDPASDTMWRLKAIRPGQTSIRFQVLTDFDGRRICLPITISEGDQ